MDEYMHNFLSMFIQPTRINTTAATHIDNTFANSYTFVIGSAIIVTPSNM